jgi:hypothetical protein
MAQDFHRLFGLGEDERYINMIDASGIALAAIQELYRENRLLRRQNEIVEGRLAALEALVNGTVGTK